MEAPGDPGDGGRGEGDGDQQQGEPDREGGDTKRAGEDGDQDRGAEDAGGEWGGAKARIARFGEAAVEVHVDGVVLHVVHCRAFDDDAHGEPRLPAAGCVFNSPYHYVYDRLADPAP